MHYSITTPKGIEVIAKWVNNHFEIITYPDAMSVIVEWAYTLDYAVIRFNWLVAKYS